MSEEWPEAQDKEEVLVVEPEKEEDSEVGRKALQKLKEGDSPASEKETSVKEDMDSKESHLGKGVGSMDEYDKLTDKEKKEYGI